MRIRDASVTLASTHTHREEHLEEESLRFWVGTERPNFEGDRQPAPAEAPAAVIVTLSNEALDRARQALAASTDPLAETAASSPESSEDPKLRTIRLILEALTGRKIKVSTFMPTEPETPAVPADPSAAAGQPERQGWGLEYDYHERHQETETVQFAASGEIHTADGQTIRFELELALQRGFVQETSLAVRAGDARLVDPLVINFDGTAAQLGAQHFLFDLDMDGTAEELPSLAAGSGFLALDRNNDGVINNGGELFGPASGNGFTELGELDSDGNGWLDENDPMFAKLRIWLQNGAAGSDTLYSLREKNIGALLLDSIATPFTLTDSANTLQGKLRETSIYLAESGEVGTIQEVDVAV